MSMQEKQQAMQHAYEAQLAELEASRAALATQLDGVTEAAHLAEARATELEAELSAAEEKVRKGFRSLSERDMKRVRPLL